MKRIPMFILITMSIGIILVHSACNDGKENKLSEYYYYPKTNMYFDVAKGNYIFSLDGAKTWDSIDARTQNEPLTLGEKTVIYGGRDSIWKDNEAHRKAYGGALYDVFSGDTAGVSAATMITEKKVAKKSKPVAPEKEEVRKERKGLGKFLNKIFGKKKKDKKEEK